MTDENVVDQLGGEPADGIQALRADELQALELQAEDANVQQFVTFYAGGETFAVDMAPVQEIIRVPTVVRVPLVPDTLEGLANLRGKILPIISLRRVFGFPERDHDEETRAIVIDLGEPLGFVVDRVASVVSVEKDKIEPASSMSGVLDTTLLSGLLKGVGEVPMTMVLNFSQLIDSEFTDIARASATLSAMHGRSEQRDEEDIDSFSDELQLVSFSVAQQEYAISISDVQEIVQVPNTFAKIKK